jgi:hypothetical protein
MGWASGLSLGTLAYESFSKDGDIKQFFSRVVNSLSNKQKKEISRK